MMYRTVAAGYAPEAGEMAAEIERAANEYARKGWEPVTFSVTNSTKAIPVFRVPEESDNEKRTTATKRILPPKNRRRPAAWALPWD